MSIKTCSSHAVTSPDVASDLAQADYIVFLRRYDKPAPAYGVHTLNFNDDEKSRRPFWVHSLGLYKESDAFAICNMAAGSLMLNMVSVDDADYESVFNYIGAQVIPLEWKSSWSDPEVRSRVLVWSVIK